MPPADMPAAEVDVTTELVTALIAEQFPELVGRPISPMANGWDNVLFRIGEDLVARLPRRAIAVANIESELRWLAELAPRLPLPVPAPVHAGAPGSGYPWPWSICPHLPGRSVLDLLDGGGALADPLAEATRMAGFFRALHVPAPPEAPENPYRGVPLSQRHEHTSKHLAALPAHVDTESLTERWESYLEIEPWTGPALWVHGDPHPGNLLTDGRSITAVIDFGDLTAGDPACDLATAWMLFDWEAREHLRSEVQADDDTWFRAEGWAFVYAVALLATSADNPPYTRMGQRLLEALDLTD